MKNQFKKRRGVQADVLIIIVKSLQQKKSKPQWYPDWLSIFGGASDI